MNADKHTAGPWAVVLGTTTGRLVIAPEAPKTRRNIAACGGPFRDGNALLVAAAPDLLEALMKIEADPANVALYLDCGGRHAIAKARGEA